LSIASFFAASSAIPRTYSFRKKKDFCFVKSFNLGVFILILTFKFFLFQC
jgi:hypothetical protein